jgi:hypothetical protein
MCAVSAASDLESRAVALATSGRGAGHAGRWASQRAAATIGVVVLAAIVLAGAAIGARPAAFAVREAPAPFAAPALPAEPVDGALTMVIPLGAAVDQQAGGRGYVMPDVIRLTVGDTIVLRNDDDVPHMILYAFLMPGETDERTFTAPGSEVYSSGCGVHAASILNFTTIFVGESA